MEVKLNFDRATKLRTFDITGLTALELATLRTALYSLRETKNRPEGPVAPYMPMQDEQDMAKDMYPKFQEAAQLARRRT